VLPLAGVNLSLTEIAIIGLSANEVARMTEIIRSGILAVDAGQHDASRALGLSRIHSAVHIVLPQATRVILPAIGNEVNVMFKNTSFVSVIGLTEILRASQLQAETSAHPLGIYFAGAVYYLLITTLWGGVQGWLEQHFDIRSSRRSVWRAWWSGLTGNISTPR
jgi:polar amino acid transport system permease protein